MYVLYIWQKDSEPEKEPINYSPVRERANELFAIALQETLNVPDVENCQALCMFNSDCLYWTYNLEMQVNYINLLAETTWRILPTTELYYSIV